MGLHASNARLTTRRQLFISTASLLAAGRLQKLLAQDDPFTVDVKVVNVLATVRNKKGEIVRTLSRDDFQIVEGTRPQNIRYFAQETDLPLTLGLLVDTSISQQKVMSAERGATMRFLDSILREDKDQVFLMQFDTSVYMRQGLTSSRKRLEDALPFVDTQTRRELMEDGGSTRLYDAVVQASRDAMQTRRDRKAMIILSDGVDTGSDTNLASAIEAAQKTDTLIYSILFTDAGFYRFGLGAPDGKGVMEKLAKETGGSYFEASKKQGIDQIFKLIEDELRSQYSIGYVSDQPVEISEFRKIHLKAKPAGLIVHARDQYWAKR